MLVRRLCSALLTTALAAGGVVLAAAPSAAESDSCATATPMAGNVASTVGPGDVNDYWRYEAVHPGTYRVTLQGIATLYVYTTSTSCSVSDCFDSTGTTKVCDFSVTTPTTVRLRASNFGTTTEAYTMSVEWTTQPRLGTQCADGVDNDGDGFADTADTGCDGLLDTSEADSPGCEAAVVVVCVALTPGDEITSVNLYGPDVVDVPLTGSIDLYQFRLANNTVVNLPCVVVTGANPCAALGGVFFARIAGVGPVTVPGVDPIIDEYLGTVRLCEATLRATVADIGVQSLPAATVC